MIDLHCHILPNLDDGAQSMEESVAMAKAACKEGIHTIVATPHHQNGVYINPGKSVLRQVKKLNDRLKDKFNRFTWSRNQVIQRVIGRL